jgi:hypothetical protein
MITAEQILIAVNEYLNGDRNGKSLVDLVDDAVSSDAVYNLTADLQKLILEFQDALAFYVPDPERRKESSSYYGPDQLNVLARKIRQELSERLKR